MSSVFNILRSSPEVPLCLLESQQREWKMHSYFGTQMAELNSHSQKWSLHTSLIPQNQPNCQWGPRIKFTLAQCVTGKEHVTLTLTWPTVQSVLGEVMGEDRSGTAALYSRMAAVFSHGTGAIIPATLGQNKQAHCPTSTQVLGHGQKDMRGPGLQPSTTASLLLLKPIHQMQLVEIRARCVSWMHKMCELTCLPRSHSH